MRMILQSPSIKTPLRLAPGYSKHLGDKWFITASPDTGRIYFSEDRGPCCIEVPLACVPASVRAKAGVE